MLLNISLYNLSDHVILQWKDCHFIVYMHWKYPYTNDFSTAWTSHSRIRPSPMLWILYSLTISKRKDSNLIQLLYPNLFQNLIYTVTLSYLWVDWCSWAGDMRAKTDNIHTPSLTTQEVPLCHLFNKHQTQELESKYEKMKLHSISSPFALLLQR